MEKRLSGTQDLMTTGRQASAKMPARIDSETEAADHAVDWIDALQSEMAEDTAARRRPRGATPGTSPKRGHADLPDALEESFVSLPGHGTGYRLNGDGWAGEMRVTDDGKAQLLEEVAILFANGQNEIVEQLLQDAISHDHLGASTTTAWAMLLDLYQVTGRREPFEEYAIYYASKFETSPPAWKEHAAPGKPDAAQVPEAIPAVTFAGSLDGGLVRQVERVQSLVKEHPALRLEFVRISSVSPVACGLLLRMLKRVEVSGTRLVLAGMPDLAHQIRSILCVGRRDETEAPWLLLLEILKLLGREAEFEDVSMDYCVTFEVSPPPFSAPDAHITMASEETAAWHEPDAHFPMPAVVEGKISGLIDAIAGHAALHQPAVIDCSGLARVEFGAAGQLFDGLMPLCRNGRQIEFQGVNHLVAALFRLVGLESIVRVTTAKN